MVISEEFEGITHYDNVTFDDQEKTWVHLTQKYGLTNRFTDETRKMFLARLLQEPLQYLDITYNRALRALRNGESLDYDSDAPRYLLYSAHDTQIANLIYNFAPNYNFTMIPYASTFIIDLKLDR